MDKDTRRQIEDMEEQSERWRAERRRLNAEIDKLEAALEEQKAAAPSKRKDGAKEVKEQKPQGIDPLAFVKLQHNADEKLKRANEDWETERAKLIAEVNRLEGAVAEAISRASNPLRVTQSIKEQFEVELNRALKDKTEIEQMHLREKSEWEQEKLRLTGEMVKLRRAAEIMGHPVPRENSKEANPKVRDLEKQLKDNLGKWNAERERLVMQIQRLEESARQWDTERRRLNEHAGQLQQAFVQASAKIQTLEVAAREPSSSELKLEELKNQNAEVEQKLEAAQSRWDVERRDMHSQIERLQQQLQRTTDTSGRVSKEVVDQLRQQHEQRLHEATQQIERLQQQLQRTTDTSGRVSKEVVDQLRQQYEQRLHETTQQKTQLAKELESVNVLLEVERTRLSTGHAPSNGNGAGLSSETINAEIARVETQLSQIMAIIDDPETELATVIRKNVEKAELDSYLKGILFSLGKTHK